MIKLNTKLYRQQACLAINKQLSDQYLTSTDFWTYAQADAMFPILWTSLTEADQARALPSLQLPISGKVFAADALRMKNATARVLRAFNDAKIPVICMRGVAVSEKLYPHAYLRPHTDIDLLFEEKHTLMAKQVVGNILHYNPLKAYPMLFKQGDIPLDLHIEPIGAERIKAWKDITPLSTKDFFMYAQESTLAGEKALLVGPRVMLPYLCFHALKHSFERLIWLYDIHLLAQQVNDLKQWDAVLEGMKEYKLERPCFYALSYVKEHMGANIPDEILVATKPNMGLVERRLFARFMKHEIIPYMAERLFSRMLPSWSQRLEFWRETIYPSLEVREQIAGGGCVKCNFIRTRLKQIGRAMLAFGKEIFLIART
ncbi:MAG: hypothetical protein AUK35_00955 [Zetaproteobacteria bacterium CG2_30_46_52]|nr:MAG: hypothetical protein AUK35_00955 [Zetaproteobacteria bacterium CG2_30_46_52]